MQLEVLVPRFVVAGAVLLALACGACGGGDASVAPPDEGGTASSDAGAPGTDGDGATGSDGSSPDGGAPSGAACSGKKGAAGNKAVTLTVAGRQRTFDLHVPPTYDATKRTPLVFLFHGYTMTASSIATASRFVATADKHGMMVAFPTGVSNSFNAGNCCGQAVAENIDDVAFTSAMITSVEGDYCLDAKRVFSAGFSNGGFLSYRLACELADKIAAVAPVAGGLGIDANACKPKRPVPLLHVHGTGDAVVPYAGFGTTKPVSDSIAAFRTKNGCTEQGAGTVVYTKSDVSCTKWGGCTANADVELCTVTNGGHQWPGGDTLPYGGSASPNLDASETIAAFFEAHPMP